MQPRPVTVRRYVTSLLLWLGVWLLVSAAAVIIGKENIWAWRDPESVHAVLGIRLYTVLTAGIVGGGLALAGLAFQALLRNPLADPYILGISGGASLGVILSSLLFSVLLAPVLESFLRIGHLGVRQLISHTVTSLTGRPGNLRIAFTRRRQDA